MSAKRETTHKPKENTMRKLIITITAALVLAGCSLSRETRLLGGNDRAAHGSWSADKDKPTESVSP